MITFAALAHASKFAAYNYTLTSSVNRGVTSKINVLLCSVALSAYHYI